MKLPQELLAELPQPDSQGLIRVTAAIKVDPEGNASVVELNDHPVDDSSEKEGDDHEPMPERDLPDLSAAEDSFYQQ
jgi:hypothetical protein